MTGKRVFRITTDGRPHRLDADDNSVLRDGESISTRLQLDSDGAMSAPLCRCRGAECDCGIAQTTKQDEKRSDMSDRKNVTNEELGRRCDEAAKRMAQRGRDAWKQPLATSKDRADSGPTFDETVAKMNGDMQEVDRRFGEARAAYNAEAWQAPLATTKSAGDAPTDPVDAARARMLERNAELWKKPFEQ